MQLPRHPVALLGYGELFHLAGVLLQYPVLLLDQPVDPEVLLIELLDAVMGVPDFMNAQT
ncbi:hypothetical protein D3C81_1599990 [compost metagenome]